MRIKYACTGIIFAIPLIIVACTHYARLYPANDLAANYGVLQAKYVDLGIGGGEISIFMPDGEELKGEYSTIDTTAVGFGSIYASVYGTGGYATGTGTATNLSIQGSSPGIATLFGNRGTRLQCEYFVNNWTSKGGGACKSSTGATFRLHF